MKFHRYHHVKFFERQKLTRLERKISKNLEEAKAAADFDDVKKYEGQLERVILDQLYVAFYPNDTKYMSLFTSHDHKTQTKQMVIRQQIFQRIQRGGHQFIQENTKKKPWVNLSFLVEKGILDSKDYDLQSSVENGKELYKEKYMDKKQIDREQELQKELQKDIQKRNANILSLSSQEQSQQTQIETEKTSGGSSDSDESSDHLNSSSDDDSVDKQKEGLTRHNPTKTESKHDIAAVKRLDDKNGPSSGLSKSKSDSSSDSSSGSSSDSSSSDSDSDSDSSSNSSSDSESDSSDGNKEDVYTSENKSDSKRNLSDNDDHDDSDDDFLVAKNLDTSPENVFAKAPRVDKKDFFLQKGDKTKGWATQKQRPGEWKKKRQRR